jgi:trans-aconitate 2-methyltransferase
MTLYLSQGRTMRKTNKLAILICTTVFSLAYTQQAISSDIKWNGPEYNENAQLQLGWAQRFLFNHYQFKGDEKILDIGSGDGKITASIAQRVPRGFVMGVDNSQSMLAQALKNYAHLTNLKFIHKDAQDGLFYQSYPNYFDVVVSFCTLHWVTDQNTVLKGMHDVLKPGGKFFLKVCSKGGDPIQAIADKLIKSDTYRSHFEQFVDPMHRFEQSEYRSLLRRMNLKVTSIVDHEERDRVESQEKLTKQIKSWLPHYHFVKKISPDVAEQYINEVIDTYLTQHPASADGSIVLYDHYLEVSGTK